MADGSNNNGSQQNGEIHLVSIGDEITQVPDPNNILANSIKERLRSASVSHFVGECCIYKVNKDFRKIDERAYTPQLVSIGPLHRGKECLKKMEECKLIYSRTLLSRATPTLWERKLSECIESIKIVSEEARNCYSEHIDLSDDKFVEMMLYDGLFIIELFRKNAREVSIDTDDPVFVNDSPLPTLIHDLVLLENQIPMLVLKCLFNQPSLREELQGSSITMLALRFFDPLMPRDIGVLEKYSNYDGKHLLDLLGKTFYALPTRVITNNKSIPSATELKNTGVKFKNASKEGSFLEVTFRGGVLEFPPVTIHDQTKSLLGNLIAFELCGGGNTSYMTSYAFFMDCIIGSETDVRILRNKGIITNRLGNDKDVLSLFNKLNFNQVDLGNFYYSDICDQVDTYCRSGWHVLGLTLKRYCLKKPWLVVSLTVISVIFTGLSFFLRKS